MQGCSVGLRVVRTCSGNANDPGGGSVYTLNAVSIDFNEYVLRPNAIALIALKRMKNTP